MNEQQRLIVDTTRRIMGDMCSRKLVDDAEAGVWPGELWQTLQNSGLTLAGVSEHVRGSGGDVADAMLVIRHGAEFAAPLPLAETFIAALLMEAVNQPVPAGPLSLVYDTRQLALSRSGQDFLLTGQGRATGWVEESKYIVMVHSLADGAKLCLLDPRHCNLVREVNIAGDPYYELRCDGLALAAASVYDLPPRWSSHRVLQAGALSRSVMMSGALNSLLAMCVQYARDRQQFGRPIAGFQAIQHQLAVLAGQVAAAGKAADLAVAAWDLPNEFPGIAVAKSRVGEAAGISTEIAHQVHGAMGFTQEHPLHHRTRRLWAWRDECGNEAVWRQQLGRQLCVAGADALWSGIIAV